MGNNETDQSGVGNNESVNYPAPKKSRRTKRKRSEAESQVKRFIPKIQEKESNSKEGDMEEEDEERYSRRRVVKRRKVPKKEKEAEEINELPPEPKSSSDGIQSCTLVPGSEGDDENDRYVKKEEEVLSDQTNGPEIIERTPTFIDDSALNTLVPLSPNEISGKLSGHNIPLPSTPDSPVIVSNGVTKGEEVIVDEEEGPDELSLTSGVLYAGVYIRDMSKGYNPQPGIRLGLAHSPSSQTTGNTLKKKLDSFYAQQSFLPCHPGPFPSGKKDQGLKYTRKNVAVGTVINLAESHSILPSFTITHGSDPSGQVPTQFVMKENGAHDMYISKIEKPGRTYYSLFFSRSQSEARERAWSVCKNIPGISLKYPEGPLLWCKSVSELFKCYEVGKDRKADGITIVNVRM